MVHYPSLPRRPCPFYRRTPTGSENPTSVRRNGERTVGGRIRRARIDAGLTIAELAARTWVTPNHLSIVERNGIKQASTKLLQRIASTLRVPFVWLKDGYGPTVDAACESYPGLVLSIVMQLDRTVTKKTIAVTLRTDVRTVDGILKGTAEYDTRWDAGFSCLVRRLDLPAAQRTLGLLSEYLNREDERKHRVLIEQATLSEPRPAR